MGRITKDDRCLIMGLRTERNWGAKRLIKEFPNKQWSLSSVTHLLSKIDNCGTTYEEIGQWPSEVCQDTGERWSCWY